MAQQIFVSSSKCSAPVMTWDSSDTQKQGEAEYSFPKIRRLRTGEKLNVRPVSRFYYFINNKEEKKVRRCWVKAWKSEQWRETHNLAHNLLKEDTDHGEFSI